MDDDLLFEPDKGFLTFYSILNEPKDNNTVTKNLNSSKGIYFQIHIQNNLIKTIRFNKNTKIRQVY